MSELAVINAVDKVGSDLDSTVCINSNSDDNIKDICIDKTLILENNSTKDEDTPMDEKRVNGIDQESLLENGAGKLIGGCSDFTRSDDDLLTETSAKETTNASCIDNSKSDMDSKLSGDDIELQDDNDNPSGFAIVAVTSNTDDTVTTTTTTTTSDTCVPLNDDGGDHGIEKVSTSNDHPEPVEIAEPDESQVKSSLFSGDSQKENTGGDDSFVMDQDDIDILLEEDEVKRAEKPESKPEEIDTMVPTSKSEPKMGEKEYEASQVHPLPCPQGDGDAPSSDAHLADVISGVKDEAHSHMESKTEKLSTLDSKEEMSVTSDDLLQPDNKIDLTQDGDASQQNVNANDACNISEEMKLKTSGESHDSQQAMSPSSSNSDNAAMHPSEEAEDKNANSLMISKVESCFNENEEMEWKNDNSQDSIKDTDIKDGEVKEKVEKEEKEDTNDKSNEIEDSKEDCGVIINECKSLNNEEFDSINTEANESIRKDDTVTKNETTDQEDSKCVASDSTVKLSFKDILKRKPSQELSVLTQETKNDPEEAIVIDETESVPIDSANERKSEVLREKEISPKVISSEKNETLKVEASSTVGEHHKKRVLSEDPESPSLKRPRIDSVNNEVVAKPIEATTTEATTVIMDSDDDSAPSPLGLDKDVTKDGEKETNQRTLKLSSQMLEKLVKASLKSFMKNQKQEKEQLIDDRMRKMENATDLWRETAKHLEKSVNELTSYTKELRKRKSQAMKLKSLSSRTVAVQVSLERTPNNQPSLAANNQIQNHSQVPHRSTSLSLPPSVLRHPNAKGLPNSPPYQVRMGQANGNNMRPNYPQQQLRTPTPRGTSPMPPGPQQMNRNRFVAAHQNSPLGQSLPSPSQQNPVMRQNLNSHVPQHSTGRVLQGRPVNASMSHSFQASASDTIDLTDEDDMSKSSNTLLPSTRLPHSSALNGHGSQPARGVPPQNNNTFMSSNNQSGGPRMHNAHNTPPSRKAAIPGSNGQYVHADNMSKLRNGNQLPNASSTAKSGLISKSGSINGLTNQSPGTESTSKGTSRSLPPSVYVAQPSKHPAPLPNEQNTKAVQTAKLPPPKPSLKISRVSQGIVLSWNMPPLESNIAKIASYQLFAYQETNSAPSSSLWKKVGDVKALPLPMACTLVQFQEGNKYFFAVRAVDQFGRWGEYSDPSSIYLFPK